MTSTIKATAHCSSDKELVITVGGQTTRLRDGESQEFYVYDDREIVAKEVFIETIPFKEALTEELEKSVFAWATSKSKFVTKLNANETAQRDDIFPEEFSLKIKTFILDIDFICKSFVDHLENLYHVDSDKNYITYRTPTIVDIDGIYEGNYFTGVFVTMLVSFS